MYWDDLLLSEVGDWAAYRMDAPPPPNLLFAPPDEQRLVAGEILSHIGVAGEATPTGTVRLSSDDPDVLWAQAADYMGLADLNRVWDEPELRPDEFPPKFVAQERLTRVEGLPSVGPGGRITAYDLPSGPFVDISIRPRAELAYGGGWRSPGDIQAAAEGMVGDARGFRLRGAFGYSEPSVYETAGLVRPTFVLILDGPPGVGRPHWRVSIAVPATGDSGDDGGEVSGSDSDWCV